MSFVATTVDRFARSQRSSLSTFLIGSTGLFLLSLLAYGSLAPYLGFYLDDWPIIWVYKSQGLSGIHAYFEHSRPFYGYLLSTLFPVLGDSTLAWQVVAVCLRLLCSIALFVFLRSLFPLQLGKAWLAAAFALLYPGFSEQPLAITYIPLHASFLMLLVSFWATIKSTQPGKGQIPFFVLSVISAPIGYLIIDYYVGLELIRPLIIYYSLSRSTPQTTGVRTALTYWLPNAIAFAMYVVWRLFIFKMWPPRYDGGVQLSRILNDPIGEIGSRSLDYLSNVFLASFAAWARTLEPASVDFGAGLSVFASWIVGSVIGLVSVCVVFIFMRSVDENQDPLCEADVRVSGKRLLLLGVAAVLVCGLPLAFANQVIIYSFLFDDRFSLPFVLGVSILFAAALPSDRRSTAALYMISTLLLLFAGAHHFRNQNYFRTDWSNTRSIFSQLAWRMPDLVPETSILMCNTPLSMRANHTAGMLDLLYGKTRDDGTFVYWLFDLDREISWDIKDIELYPGRFYATSLKTSGTLASGVRRFTFRGSAEHAVVVWASPSGTLRVLDPRTTSEITNLSNSCRYASHLSNPSRIREPISYTNAWPLLAIQNGSGGHDWQFNYQAADLARQNKDWTKVAMIADKLQSQQMQGTDVNEWFLFIEGYAMANRLENAVRLTAHVLDKSPKETRALSILWNRILTQRSPGMDAELSILSSLKDRLSIDLIDH
jgi:hypothetical protein